MGSLSVENYCVYYGIELIMMMWLVVIINGEVFELVIID